ncbi:hypothetical protein GCM10023187_10500 [Nibrella viscosa]|uniref:HTH araC/xylS-type domain-containing protein n=1 Tax=Nibrella viscosa TaxID=1084524 RepID=A0ABP8K249_9BACT
MITVVEDFLLYLVRRAKKRFRPIVWVSQVILQSPAGVSLDWLADQACLSQRQFYRQFVEREGISPKLYARTARFGNAIRIRNAHPDKDWLTVAVDLDYYDYQHLVRDFKEFTRMTPNEFMQQEAQAPERSFGVAET